MLINLLIGLVVIGITVYIQGHGTHFWMKYIGKKFFPLSDTKFNKKSLLLIIFTASSLLILHLVQASIWACTYYLIPGITEFQTMEKAIYFSLVTFTTLGYGDITIGSEYRLLAGLEAINGILLIGWSTALMFSLFQFILKREIKQERNEETKSNN